MVKPLPTSLERFLFGTLSLLLLLTGFFFAHRLDIDFKISIFFVYLLMILFFNYHFSDKEKRLMSFKKEYLTTLFLAILVILMFIWDFNPEHIAFLSLFISFLLFAWDSRIISAVAVVSLLSSPILLIAKQGVYAEYMALYSYYFLLLSVGLHVIEYIRHHASHGEKHQEVEMIYENEK